MVKVNGPMFSLGASGTLADALTFSQWKGRPYVRERVIPSNPKSGAQTGRRAMFKFLTQQWNSLAAAHKATFQDLADEIIASPFNAYLRANMKRWHNFLAPSTQFDAPGVGALPTYASDPTANWEENRIRFNVEIGTINYSWGLIVFASLTSSFSTTVGNAIIVQQLDTTDPAIFYWTPPSVATWYFNTRAITTEGRLGPEIEEITAAP